MLAATAVGALVTISVSGAIQPMFEDGLGASGAAADAPDGGALALAGNEDHDGGRGDRMRRVQAEGDDDDHEDDDDGDDDEDDAGDDDGDEEDRTARDGRGVSTIPAPAGETAPAPVPVERAAPPANRLFGNGTPPKVQVN
jgi:hypothetical protein